VADACDRPFDLVAVHSPPFQHREHVLRALDAGKNVLCDKPFGVNAVEAREMRDAAKASGLLHFLNFEFRFDTLRAKVEQLLRSGAIGRPVHVSYRACIDYLREGDHGWINEAELGGGWLGALASHVIDTMRWQLDSEVANCGGVSRIDVPVRPDGKVGQVTSTAEDAFAIWMTFANGATATVEGASTAPVSLPLRVSYFGTEGVIEVTGDDSINLLRKGADPETVDLAPLSGPAMFAALGAWVGTIEDAIGAGKQVSPSFDDGVAMVEVLDKLKQRVVRPPSA
jgi:predicted dehydrogenase